MPTHCAIFYEFFCSFLVVNVTEKYEHVSKQLKVALLNHINIIFLRISLSST